MRRLLTCAALSLALVTLVVPTLGQTAAAVTLEGQVVCSDCWFEQDDRKAKPYGSESELKCAVRCSKDGIPQALAVWEGEKATLYVLEQGAFKKGKDFLEFAGKQVKITGHTRRDKDKQVLKVDALTVVAEPAAAVNPEPALGSQAPEVALRDLSGQEQTLASYKGKIVVLNFWATWCAPCRKEMPAFVNLQSEYAAWGVQVIAASADAPETRDQVVKFVREKKLSFPVWTGATKEQMLAFGLGEELPGTVILDRDGNVVARYKGVIKESELRKQIDDMLAKQQAAQPGAGADVAEAKAKSSVPA